MPLAPFVLLDLLLDFFVQLIEPGLVARVLRATIQAANESLLFDDVHDETRKDHSTVRVERDRLHFRGGFDGFRDGLSEFGAGLIKFCCRLDGVSAEPVDAFV